MSYDMETPPDETKSLMAYALARKLNIVIGGDANAHHSIWGCNDINIRGECLLQFIIEYKLTIANQGNQPTFIGSTSKNVLDLTLYTDHDNCTIENWRVLSRPSYSDHRYISFCVKTNIVPNRTAGFRNARKTD